jgi:hypothetical protein
MKFGSGGVAVDRRRRWLDVGRGEKELQVSFFLIGLGHMG